MWLECSVCRPTKFSGGKRRATAGACDSLQLLLPQEKEWARPHVGPPPLPGGDDEEEELHRVTRRRRLGRLATGGDCGPSRTLEGERKRDILIVFMYVKNIYLVC